MLMLEAAGWPSTAIRDPSFKWPEWGRFGLRVLSIYSELAAIQHPTSNRLCKLHLRILESSASHPGCLCVCLYFGPSANKQFRRVFGILLGLVFGSILGKSKLGKHVTHNFV